jgi:hypothetical protein
MSAPTILIFGLREPLFFNYLTVISTISLILYKTGIRLLSKIQYSIKYGLSLLSSYSGRSVKNKIGASLNMWLWTLIRSSIISKSASKSQLEPCPGLIKITNATAKNKTSLTPGTSFSSIFSC